MKKITSILLFVSMLLLVLLTGCGGGTDTSSTGNEGKNQQEPAKNTQSAPEIVPVYTPGSGGAAYILGGGIASIVNKYNPDINLVAEAASGSVEIVKLVDERNQQGKSALAVIASDGVYNGYKGINEFSQAYPGIRAVNFLYGAELYLVVPKNSPIKAYADVKGKRIGIGAPGSTVSSLATLIFEKSGLAKDQYKALPLGYQEVVQGIKDGSIDGGFIAGATPVAAYNELCSSTDVRIVPVDDAIAQDIVKSNPYYYQTKVKGGIYKGVDSDVPILAFGVLILANEKAGDELVYKTIKTLLDKHGELIAIHKTAEQMTPETVLNSVGIPLHPGAEKYYREVGILK